MLTPKMLAKLIPEQIEDTYTVLKEDRKGMLYHRRQRAGTKFEDDTPLEIVLDFLKEAGTGSRYDLQSFLDRLQSSIAAQAEQMYEDSVNKLVELHQSSTSLDDGTSDDRVDWLDAKLNDVKELLINVVPVIRRSQAQARSLSHAQSLLERHRERMITAIQQLESEAPEGIESIMDNVHTVAGGILESCDVVGTELLPIVW